MSATRRAPNGLGSGGRALWRAVVESHELDATQHVQLEEACRCKDRLDKLDALLRGDAGAWVSVEWRAQRGDCTLSVDDALAKANSTATLMKQLIASLRLPDETTGKRPHNRGAARGAYTPTAAKGVASLDRARQAK